MPANAERFEETFYGKKNLDPQMHKTKEKGMGKLPDGVDMELIAKVPSNLKMKVLLAKRVEE